MHDDTMFGCTWRGVDICSGGVDIMLCSAECAQKDFLCFVLGDRLLQPNPPMLQEDLPS